MGNSWLDIENKVVIVTGGSSCIGRQIVQSLLDNKAVVYNADLRDNPIDHSHYHFKETNVVDEEAVRSTVQSIFDEQSQIDVLVNNAGINLPRLLVDAKGEKPEYEINMKDLDLMLGVNLKGPVLFSQEVSRYFIKSKKALLLIFLVKLGKKVQKVKAFIPLLKRL